MRHSTPPARGHPRGVPLGLVFNALHIRLVVLGGDLWAKPRNPPLDRGRHANLALLSLVGSMAYGFAIIWQSHKSIPGLMPMPHFLIKYAACKLSSAKFKR
jgi:hypothetical protein